MGCATAVLNEWLTDGRKNIPKLGPALTDRIMEMLKNNSSTNHLVLQNTASAIILLRNALATKPAIGGMLKVLD